MNKRTNYKHGDEGTIFYNKYGRMKNRCRNPNHKAYDRYGGRGIKCHWDEYLDFKEDMYESYKKHVEEYGVEETTLDRIDNDGDYCKENCRWATNKQQSNNCRDNVKLEFRGEKKNVSQWAEETGLNYTTIYYRVFNAGWSVEKALTTPVQGQTE